VQANRSQAKHEQDWHFIRHKMKDVMADDDKCTEQEFQRTNAMGRKALGGLSASNKLDRLTLDVIFMFGFEA
jgi:hypothetical protein